VPNRGKFRDLCPNREKTGNRRAARTSRRYPESPTVDRTDRVLVVGGASTRIGFDFEIRREFVDQQLDLVAVQVVVLHRGRDALIYAVRSVTPKRGIFAPESS
jgi:hypothetical protein